MEAELIISIVIMSLAGAGLGTFSGLVPGIHVNTLAVLMFSFYPSLHSFISMFFPSQYAAVLVAACIVSAAVVHSFVAFVPSVFLGAPDPDEVMNILPGHRMLLEGRGMAAVRASAAGSAVGTISAAALAVPMQFLISEGLGDYLESITVSVLLIAAAALVIKERGKGKLWAALLIILSGILGYLCMSVLSEPIGIIPGGNLLFPLLTGLFGVPALLLSPKNGSVPDQRDDGRSPVGDMPGIKGVAAGAVAGWFPGITSTSVAVIFAPGSEKRPEDFICFVSSISSAAAVFAVVTLSMTGNGRTGTMIVTGDILGGSVLGLGNGVFILMLLSIVTASLIGYLATIVSGKLISRAVSDSDMGSFNRIAIVAVTVLVALMTGPLGLAVLLVASLLGLVPTAAGVSRVHLSGCLIVPVILFRILL